MGNQGQKCKIVQIMENRHFQSKIKANMQNYYSIVLNPPIQFGKQNICQFRQRIEYEEKNLSL